jgi:hypothetical protein
MAKCQEVLVEQIWLRNWKHGISGVPREPSLRKYIVEKKDTLTHGPNPMKRDAEMISHPVRALINEKTYHTGQYSPNKTTSTFSVKKDPA